MIALSDLLEDCDTGHDDTQISSFMIIKNGGTPWGCYKQALRELHSRVRTLQGLWINQQRVLKRVEAANDDLDKLEAEVELWGLDSQIKSLKREAGKIYLIAAHLKEGIGELTSDKAVELDQELWLHKIKVQAVNDLLDRATLSSSTRGMIQSLPKPMRASLQESLQDPDSLVGWFMEYEVALPNLELIPASVSEEIEHATNPCYALERSSN